MIAYDKQYLVGSLKKLLITSLIFFSSQLNSCQLAARFWSVFLSAHVCTRRGYCLHRFSAWFVVNLPARPCLPCAQQKSALVDRSRLTTISERYLFRDHRAIRSLCKCLLLTAFKWSDAGKQRSTVEIHQDVAFPRRVPFELAKGVGLRSTQISQVTGGGQEAQGRHTLPTCNLLTGAIRLTVVGLG